ncbi:MAG: hypothetical protein V3U76_11045 [Granulosicoccus sp.]
MTKNTGLDARSAGKYPLGIFGEPVKEPDLALFLASPASGLTNGETLMIDGGCSKCTSHSRLSGRPDYHTIN